MTKMVTIVGSASPIGAKDIVDLLGQVPRITSFKMDDGSILMVGSICAKAKREIERQRDVMRQVGSIESHYRHEIERLQECLEATYQAIRGLEIELEQEKRYRQLPPEVGYAPEPPPPQDDPLDPVDVPR